MIREIAIGNRPVGPGHPAYLVAEIGINHNGDMDLGRRMIDAAREAGADAVKFQTYRTEEFVPDRDLAFSYEADGETVTVSQFDMFKAAELTPARLDLLIEHCTAIGIDWHSTPMGIEGVSELVSRGVGVLKNGSDCLGHLPLIEAMGRSGLPTAISTGMATLADIDEAVSAFRATGNDRLILLLCTSQYPCAPEEVNLRRMPALGEVFGCLTGFSDHTFGVAAATAAAAMGASWIEKHFTLDKALPGPDHRFSADPEEFAALVKAVRTVEAALGSPEFTISPAEAEARSLYRLSCAAARDLPAGHVLAAADIVFLRPGSGLPPRDAPGLVGRKLAEAHRRGAVITGRGLV